MLDCRFIDQAAYSAYQQKQSTVYSLDELLISFSFSSKYYGILKAERPDADKIFEEVKETILWCCWRTNDVVVL